MENSNKFSEYITQDGMNMSNNFHLRGDDGTYRDDTSSEEERVFIRDVMDLFGIGNGENQGEINQEEVSLEPPDTQPQESNIENNDLEIQQEVTPPQHERAQQDVPVTQLLRRCHRSVEIKKGKVT